jgi:hypothetical protein
VDRADDVLPAIVQRLRPPKPDAEAAVVEKF